MKGFCLRAKCKNVIKEVPDYDDEEEKKGMSDHDNDASANAAEASDLAEPTTFQDAISGPNQVHWRKAIQA